MAAWQYDAAMIYLGRRGFGHFGNLILPRNQRAAAGRAPVGDGLLGQNGMALGADPFHIHRLTDETSVLRRQLPHSRYTVDMHPPVRLVAIDMDGTLLPTL
jgi:hypothetical protein